MQRDDLPYQGQPESHAAVFPAPGFVHTEKRLKNAVSVLLRDAAAGIRDPDNGSPPFLGYRDMHRPVRTVIPDGIFGQIVEHSVDQRVAAGHNAVACAFKAYAVPLCKRRKVGEDLLRHRSQLYAVGARHRPKRAHLQQRFCHLRHPFGLLTQQAEKIRRFRQYLGMLCGKQLKLCLHQGERRAQLVGCVSGKLPLRGKALVKAVEHLVERPAELPELRQDVLVDLHIRQIVRLNLFHLRGKRAQRLQRMSAQKVCEHPAEQRHRRRDIPVGRDIGFLCPVNDDRQILIELFTLRIEKVRFCAARISVIRNVGAYGIHIVPAGITGEDIHKHTGGADQKRGHQGNAPL